MIDIIPTLSENISGIATTYPVDTILTSWGMVYQIEIIFLILGIFIGWGIGYHCYRLGIRFPWHKDDD